MTDTESTTETPVEDVQETPQEPAADVQEPEPQEEQDPAAAARREAASYRRKLRDTESERDRLASTVEAFQRRDAERFMETDGFSRMASGADLWAAGVQLADVLGDDGHVDPVKAKAVKDRVLSERPHWRRPMGDASQGVRGTSPNSGISFADVLRAGAENGYVGTDPAA